VTPRSPDQRSAAHVVHHLGSHRRDVGEGGRASGVPTPRHPWLRALALGPAVWLAGYARLPLAGVYKPIWESDARTLGKDLSAHLVYGVTTSAVCAALTREGP
jgi:hypothetical protein